MDEWVDDKISEDGGQFYQLVELKTYDVREEACSLINLPIPLQDAGISKIKNLSDFWRFFRF